MEYIRFKDVIINSQYGYTAAETSLTEGTYKYLRITDIVPYYVDFESVPFCKITEKDVSKYIVNEGDILIARTGATTGYNYVVPSGINNTVYASYLIRFVVDKKLVLPLFLKYVFKTQSYYGFVNNYIGGAAQPGMNAKVFTKFNIPKFSLITQQKIASILSAYDCLIENNTRRIRLLEQMAENLYKEWFVRFRFPGHENVEMVNGLPKGWERVVASSIIDVMSGGTPKTAHQEFYNGNIPFYTPKDANDSIFVYNTLTNITEEGLVHCNSRLYPRNTLIITARGTVGKLSLLAVPMAMNQSCFALQLKKGNNPFFLYYAIRTEVAKLKKMANGGVFDTIVVKSFDHIKLMVPSHSLMDNFNLKVCPILEKVRSLSYQNQLLTRQRDLLLPRLMSGKLEVKS
jgi:type I restriction modification DNA specificity domain protein